MYRLSNPIIWLRRFRHRCGYGVHSPFAFHFITDVIYEKAPYYAYRDLDKSLPLKDRLRVRKVLHLLLRISNWKQPKDILCLMPSNNVVRYLKAGCRKSNIIYNVPEGQVDLCWLSEPCADICIHLHEHSMLVLDNLDKHKEWFLNLPSVISFDLYDIGIAFFDTKYNKQHYIVNF